MSLIPALGRQSQMNLCGFRVSMVYRWNSRIARATQKNPVSKNQNQPNKQTKNPKTTMTKKEKNPKTKTNKKTRT